jgi:hypothetical protein
MLALIALLTLLSDDPAQQAKAALARDLDISEASIRVESVRAVDWPDAGLGCPQKGENYDSQEIPGHLVVLRVDRKRYEVHLGDGRAVVCDSLKRSLPTQKTPTIRDTPPPDRSPPIPMPEDGGLRKLVEQARLDLAERLSVEESDILLVELKEVVWPDRSLGCPQPGMKYLQVPSDGLLIRLRVEDRSYRYHKGGMKPPFLCENPSQ